MLSALVALGSNLGHRPWHLFCARDYLSALGEITACSPIYETPALLPQDALEGWNIPFLNQVIQLRTSLADPEMLLAKFKEIETSMGRTHTARWAPRVIDIDLLSLADIQMQTETLTLPHAAMHQRAFVMQPLVDIAPDFMFPPHHPCAKKTAREVLTQCADSDVKLSQQSQTRIAGIVNITPDSFSDGGEAFTPALACKRIYTLAEEGAERIDIGAQSTRPGAVPISAEQEWARLSPVLHALSGDAHKRALMLSIDTFYPEVAARALEAGVAMINDVSGLKHPEMATLLAGAQCEIVSMHSLTLPADKAHTLPHDTNMQDWLENWVSYQLQRAEEYGIARHRLWLDPGIGFGKTAAQSSMLCEIVSRPRADGLRFYIGHSRKSFLAQHAGLETLPRDEATLVLSERFMRANLGFLRVHDVASHVKLRNQVSGQ